MNQKEIDLDDEYAVYTNFIDNFQRFASGKKQRDKDFQVYMRSRFKKYNKNQNTLKLDKTTSLLNDKQILLDMIKQKDFFGENGQQFSCINEKYLIAKRYRQNVIENQVDPFGEKDQIMKNIQIVLSKLKMLHMENGMEGYQNILKKYGKTLIDLLQFIKSDKIEGKVRKMVKKFYDGLNFIMESISNIEQREELNAILNFTN